MKGNQPRTYVEFKACSVDPRTDVVVVRTVEPMTRRAAERWARSFSAEDVQQDSSVEVVSEDGRWLDSYRNGHRYGTLGYDS